MIQKANENSMNKIFFLTFFFLFQWPQKKRTKGRTFYSIFTKYVLLNLLGEKLLITRENIPCKNNKKLNNLPGDANFVGFKILSELSNRYAIGFCNRLIFDYWALRTQIKKCFLEDENITTFSNVKVILK